MTTLEPTPADTSSPNGDIFLQKVLNGEYNKDLSRRQVTDRLAAAWQESPDLFCDFSDVTVTRDNIERLSAFIESRKGDVAGNEFRLYTLQRSADDLQTTLTRHRGIWAMRLNGTPRAQKDKLDSLMDGYGTEFAVPLGEGQEPATRAGLIVPASQITGVNVKLNPVADDTYRPVIHVRIKTDADRGVPCFAGTDGVVLTESSGSWFTFEVSKTPILLIGNVHQFAGEA